MASKTHPLRHFVHRVLLIRLFLATSAIAIVITAIAYHVQQERLHGQITEIGQNRMTEVIFRTGDLLSRESITPIEAFQQALREASLKPTVFKKGRFVYARFYDLNAGFVAETHAIDIPNLEKIKPYVASHPMIPSPDKELASEEMRFDGDVFVHLALSIMNRQKQSTRLWQRHVPGKP